MESLVADVVDGQTFCNPLGVALADPHILADGDRYYLYGTTSPAEGYQVWSGDNLIDWHLEGFALRKSSTSWGRRHFWAPCVIKKDQTYLLYYSAVGAVGGGQESHRICLAASQSPTGPFVDVVAPLLDVGRAVIDAHVLIDGQRGWLYYALDCSENGVSEIYVVPLSADMCQVGGDPVRCIGPSQGWEGVRWNEAPYVFRSGSWYVMTYSAQGFFDPRYAVGYATARHPQGPWIKAPENPILCRNELVSGPGHNCIASSPDGSELFIVYHAHRRRGGGHARELAMDRLLIEQNAEDGLSLKAIGPTRAPQPRPAARRARPQAA